MRQWSCDRPPNELNVTQTADYYYICDAVRSGLLTVCDESTDLYANDQNASDKQLEGVRKGIFTGKQSFLLIIFVVNFNIPMSVLNLIGVLISS